MPHLWPKSYRTVRCLVQRRQWTLLWGWRRKSHHSHIATLHRDDQWFLSPNLPPNNRTLWFQQDGATTLTAAISIAALRRLFPQRVIYRFGDVPWPLRSLDLTAPDLSLWGYLKSKVYSNRPTDLHALKENIGMESPNFQKKNFKPLCAAS